MSTNSNRRAGRKAMRGRNDVLRAVACAAIGAVAALSPAHAKIPGARHCYNDICHRVLSLSETATRIGRVENVMASFYGAPGADPYNPRSETSSGEKYRPDRDDNIASPIYPDGTRLLLWNPANGHAASVRVNNAGPYMGARTIDTSEQLAKRLGFYHQGVARLHVVVISAPSLEESNYRRGRRYDAVPGFLGRFPSLQLALLAEPSAATAALEFHVPAALAASVTMTAALAAGSLSDAGNPPLSAGRRAAAMALALAQSRTRTAGTKADKKTRPLAVARATGITQSKRQPVPASQSGSQRKASTRCAFDVDPVCG